MTDHEHELPSRDPRSLLAEADYWQEILADLKAMNDGVAGACDGIIDTQAALLPLIFMPAALDHLEQANSAARLALEAVKAIGERVAAIADLAEGRLVMIRREGGLSE